ncbi:hypothetical protein [Primorskyibacter sp. S87]|uniref:hypothetical protein n=1 Tax=Primorskyibacter sp. S87 TaxID=3415126 RepID=UPI003C7E60AC
MKKTIFRYLVWLPLVLAAGPVHAHAPIPGIKGFYVGLLHPFSTPSQAVLMLGLGLLVGGFAVAKVRWFLGAFLVFSVLGVVFGSANLGLDAALFSAAVAACSLAALAPGRLMPLGVVLTAVGAVLIGFVSIPDAGLQRDRVITMSGSLVGANIGLLYLWGFTYFVKQRLLWPWVGIGFRIAAAWVAAIALLMLALGLAAVDTAS